MTFNYYKNKVEAEARRQQFEEQAARNALVNTTQSSAVKQGPLYGPALAKAGKVLESLGQQLQNRYGESAKAPLTPPMQPVPSE